MKSWLMSFCASLTIGIASTNVHAEATEKAFVDAVKMQAMPLKISSSGLTGPGASWLVKEAEKSQFVLIGEDHGFADIPQFAMGLQASLADKRFDHLVLEIGFYAAQKVEESLCDSKDGLKKLNNKFPFFSPFVNFTQDGALAASFASCDRADPALWGVDQEFLLATQMHLDNLYRLASGNDQRKQLSVFRKRADSAWQNMVAKHNPESIALTQWTTQDFKDLQDIFNTDNNMEALALINAMAASAEIYHSQNTAPYKSNRDRSLMMKSYFMRNYLAAQATESMPRALFKLGAYHAARGLTPTQQFDIGNMASELAESNGGRSLHILVLMQGGEVNRHFPFSADNKDQHFIYDAKEELKPLGIDALLAISPAQDASVIDLVSLREAGKPRMPSGSAINKLIYNYDAVVLVAKGHAATNY
ncbi:MAG: hypothetical protein ABI644_05010 [Arenimonas sp.]